MQDKTLFSVTKADELSSDEYDRIIDKTAEVFRTDPCFCYLFRRQEEVAKAIVLHIKFFYRSGQMYICRDDAGEICGVSLWVDRDGEMMNKANMKKYGVIGDYRRSSSSLSPAAIFRFVRMATCTEKRHLRSPHCYLVMLASFKKGAGTALMEDYLATHNMETLYLENSNMEANTHFYEKFGFKPFERIMHGKVEFWSMIRPGGE